MVDEANNDLGHRIHVLSTKLYNVLYIHFHQLDILIAVVHLANIVQ